MSCIIDSEKEVESLPTNVASKEQLSLLPEKYLSTNPKRPLYLHPYEYALRPLFYSALFILIVEGLERFTYYGISSTETAFLTGSYDSLWNANMTAVQAASYTSASVGIAYSAPFLGGILADGWLGDYWSIIFGVTALYIPGLILIALTTFPGLLGSVFNTHVLTAGLLVLMPLGTGFIKSVVNVFGAKQYHPILQASQLESYYINFYLSINVGSLIGITLIPVLAQIHLQIAYMLPAIALVFGLLVFIAGSKRYIRRPPEKTALLNTFKVLGQRLACKPFDQSKKSHGGPMDDTFVDGVKRLLVVVPLSLLIVPFVIAYSQMSTVFVLQGEAMQKMGLLDASLMQSFDPISVLIAGILVGSYMYPALSNRAVRIPLTYKFAIGTAFGSLAIVSAIVVDHFITTTYHTSGSQIPIIWQAFSYVLVGFGEIFAFTSCLEAAFTIAPREQKGLVSATNQFLTVGVSSFICIALNGALGKWFPQPDQGSTKTEQYANSEMSKFLWVTFGITIFGIVINLLPPVKRWVDAMHLEAIKANAKISSSSEERSENEGLDEKGEARETATGQPDLLTEFSIDDDEE